MAFKLKNQIERRENTGEKVIDTNADALDCLPSCLDDKDADPAIPIADKRVEDFLNWIIDADAHTTEEYYTAYREYMTPITGIRHIDINNMRRMMMKQRIRERIKFLRAAEWEINKPTIIGVTKRLENIINQEENKPADVVKRNQYPCKSCQYRRRKCRCTYRRKDHGGFQHAGKTKRCDYRCRCT